jgi:hypothetical protein
VEPGWLVFVFYFIESKVKILIFGFFHVSACGSFAKIILP